jgi:hypothetical protein
VSGFEDEDAVGGGVCLLRCGREKQCANA